MNLRYVALISPGLIPGLWWDCGSSADTFFDNSTAPGAAAPSLRRDVPFGAQVGAALQPRGRVLLSDRALHEHALLLVGEVDIAPQLPAPSSQLR